MVKHKSMIEILTEQLIQHFENKINQCKELFKDKNIDITMDAYTTNGFEPYSVCESISWIKDYIWNEINGIIPQSDLNGIAHHIIVNITKHFEGKGYEVFDIDYKHNLYFCVEWVSE